MKKYKECTKCYKKKKLTRFSKHKLRKDGLDSWCKSCYSICNSKRYKTPKGVATTIYNSQHFSSVPRNHPIPNYTLDEFKEWMFSQDNWLELHKNWVKSGYIKDLKPSCDRLDDYLPYTLSNIRLVTWKENREKYYQDAINGVNKKSCKPIVGTCIKTNSKIEFFSQAEAERNGFNRRGVGNCLKGRSKMSGGYAWEYA